jgi:hypothetical protein
LSTTDIRMNEMTISASSATIGPLTIVAIDRLELFEPPAMTGGTKEQ